MLSLVEGVVGKLECSYHPTGVAFVAINRSATEMMKHPNTTAMD
jgi:hypothetical protein